MKSEPTESEIRSIPNSASHLKILGVTFEASLKWDIHVENVSKCASQRVHVLRMLKRIPGASKTDVLQVYYNYVLSVLEYNSPLFVGLNTRNQQRMERIAKRCHRIICGESCHCGAFQNINQRRQNQAMKVFSKMMNPDNISHSLLPPPLPRTGHLFIEHCTTNRRANSFVPFCSLLWNSRQK